MEGWYSLLFQPLAGSVYKWQGEFSPQFRGPQAYSESRSLPLPSTIAGVLAGVEASRRGLPAQDECLEGEVYGATRNLLEDLLGEGFKIRGPYFYIEGRRGTAEVKLLCMAHKGVNLYCVNAGEPSETLILKPLALQNTGIALDTLSKSVIEHYIYTIKALDLHATTARVVRDKLKLHSVKRYGILVEVYADNARDLLDGKIVWMGGRQRPYRIEVLGQTPARSIASRASENAVVHIVSPILFCGSYKMKIPLIEPGLERKLYETLCTSLKLSCGEICSRITFTALGLGYDLCRGRKRPYCQTVMPGAQFKASVTEPLKLYDDGVGAYSELGWGTLLPLPAISRACSGEE
ncbi:MAG: hypothetical protein LRS46_00235 [Desulfurococcales archaeon]|nr:hypothetical protein [Desulfurococcales archaeon]